jgi:hypothetical protein
MVVVEKLTKDAHFILVKLIYMREIVRLHGVPKEIVSNRDPKFTSNFWRGLFKGFGTNLNFNTTYHPVLDEKAERIK